VAALSREAQVQQAQLTRRFIASLPEKRAELEASWKLVQASRWSPESLAQLRHLAHKLAGSMGSYGLGELGALALDLEVTLVSAASSREQHALIEQRARNLLEALASAPQ
jgi:HPt (histidine-containing phosphotransfer) domain-containing protein